MSDCIVASRTSGTIGDGSGTIWDRLGTIGTRPQLSLHAKAQKKRNWKNSNCVSPYLAYSITLVSLIILTLIWPGYSISSSIFLVIFLDFKIISSSEILSGLTITLISLPACIANDLSTPSKESAISSSACFSICWSTWNGRSPRGFYLQCISSLVGNCFGSG